MQGIYYVFRCVVVLLFVWACVRMIGKKSISQMTTYDFTALVVLANVAAEPLTYKVNSKAFLGTFTIALVAVIFGWLSLKRIFYNFDTSPDIIIINGKVDKEALKKNRMNLPFLLSLLRLQGYTNVSDVEFAILEPNGNLSVIPKSQKRSITPEDLNIDTEYEGLALPLIIDGRVIEDNMNYVKLDHKWLEKQLEKAGVTQIEDIFLAELQTNGELYIDLKGDNLDKPSVI